LGRKRRAPPTARRCHKRKQVHKKGGKRVSKAEEREYTARKKWDRLHGYVRRGKAQSLAEGDSRGGKHSRRNEWAVPKRSFQGGVTAARAPGGPPEIALKNTKVKKRKKVSLGSGETDS